MKETVEWDDKRGGLVVTRQEHINIKDAKSIIEAEEKLRRELSEIVQQVKNLKTRSGEIKNILAKLQESPE